MKKPPAKRRLIDSAPCQDRRTARCKFWEAYKLTKRDSRPAKRRLIDSAWEAYKLAKKGN